ncbi:MAG: quinone-dependent dihydroorotate dehydrogenase [Paludibacterium sp.]|uniref:quinone-dependent dihydroorotate dehydrogenase n=1 Tax=Paludibacterium sp. TaxID=1917523 RepID=UPI0025D5A6BE|nr:quinone-dependent dihydroorotate dehydrogenase [Paludibacterium sp.]MBV8049202.1 quinone-dependent dihydroorotate dehydrogenase [Paludibacterium sp.]MBV8647257.1 quinone-dependent dihydroorotate dehydrogenase [Paludibacterium sp.]
MLYPLLRPLLFRLDPEKAHELTLRSLDLAHHCHLMRLAVPAPVIAPVTAMGITFANAVGLAAGLDKNGAHIDALFDMGFGFVEIGTVTPLPQPGNDKPRMFRVVEQQGIINRMGFNNLGVDALVANVRHSKRAGILGINIGKNAVTPIERAADDYLAAMDKVYPLADYIAVNISSPNTKNLRQLQQGDELSALLLALKTRQQALADQHGRYVPLAVKIAPDLDAAQIADIARLLIAHRIDGVIAGNTTLSRDAIAGHRHAAEAGGLSGAPLTDKATALIRALAVELDGALPIIGVGGILCGRDATDKIAAGATLVQLYSGLVYRGPALIAEIARAIAQRAANGN